MSDDQDTVQLPAVTSADRPDADDEESDETLTDEFRVDQDIHSHEATRRLDSKSMKAIQGAPETGPNGIHAEAAVPGRNSTMPLPAVAASKTEANRVPEAVLAAMRDQEAGKATTPAREPIESETAVMPPGEVLGPDDETVDRARPNIKPLMADSMTEEQYPAVSFMAEIDGDGKIFIPRQYMGMLRYGQKVAVQVQVIPEMDN